MHGIHAYISGRVQGVGFRYSCHQEALKYQLSGSVRNLDDGRVEVWAAGDSELMARFITWLGRGPRWAHVTDVELRELSQVQTELLRRQGEFKYGN